MFWQTVIAVSLLGLGANTAIADAITEGMLAGRSPALQRRMHGRAKRASTLKRQAATSSNITPSGETAGTVMNMTAWDAQVAAACLSALTKLPASTNPSGTCICYNLPALNNSTGAFEADLRLYQLSAPTGAFADILPQDIQVSISYSGASVSPISAQAVSQSKRDVIVGSQAEVSGTDLKLLQSYMFVGQIDQAKMGGIMNM